MKLLIDLSILRHPYCGLGQIAASYGRWFAEHPDSTDAGLEITLLVPKAYEGAFGNGVDYLVAKDIYRHLPYLMPRFDTWHSIHQLSPFHPFSDSTRRILTIHDVNFIYEKHGAKRKHYIQRLQREIDSAADLCFISRFAQNDVARHLTIGTKPQHVIYNGVPDLTIGMQEPVSTTSRPFFLAIGVVKAKKNLHTLLPVMELFPDYQLLIAGDDRDTYAQQIKSQCPSNVHILGTVSDTERRWLYAHCSALLFPSLAEGFGLPVIEAMQWGKPVFCSNLTSLPEIGSTHAFYFTDFEPESMEATIRKGLADFDTAHADAERQYAATFSCERHMAQYIDLYSVSISRQ